jgi:hypothetical protein
LLQAILDQPDHDVVRHQSACVHYFFRRHAQLGAVLDRGAQHVAGGDLRDIVFFLDEVSLGAFTGARRS